MAELSVRQGEVVVTVDAGEKRRLTWFGLRGARSRLLDGMEVRVPVVRVTGVQVADAYWELPEQMDARDTTRSAQTRGTYEAAEGQPWVGIFPVTQDGVTRRKLCFIHGQHSQVVVVELAAGGDAAFDRLVVTCPPYETESVSARIKAAANLT